ncbi:class I SAM-dependent DNA methyltransferase [Paracoccus sp. M683]|uniref:class I SAM-dependent DNA methyltransferase n=1 Tax=Alphaproteobacteria TaxID=28211 RepID=UPI00117E1784|nr:MULTISPECIES: DNA methyltransferase [Alphaproteobacteria]MCB2160432.1 class I SAM-dependent DNA methyltransferase [Paracoccaceae bacterium]MCO6388715.1 N-6 DNA methylase [Aliihoeflea sp. 40Bstr573]TRW93247.1 class I SAM-dependent DNA methyltransferase [Paracoccus sp. M683]
MNPTEIYEALANLASKPFDAAEFPFEFALATDNAPATIAKLKGGTYNKSDIPDGVLLNQKFHFSPALPGMSAACLDALRASKRNAKHRPAILIATDGQEIAAEHPKSGDTLYCAFSELGDRFGFFLPAAGKERYRAAEENPVDVKVAGKLAKLYDALIRKNPDWAEKARQHDMNQLMTRLIFCMFAEDVGIFPENQFSRLIFTHAGDRGEGMREVLINAFTAMNTPKPDRGGLPASTREFEYVNGGLFAGRIDAPVFDVTATRYLKDVCGETWTGINPDIFGSMIQSVANAKLRSELGMHYTSVPNIMKVLGPLFLDDLDAEIEKAWGRERALRQVLERIGKIRVFDPACGSGNFLVVAYRSLREREIRILTRLAELTGGAQTEMWSAVPIRNFYGIELTDFAVETAKLALFIAEYQANALFKEAFGRKPADLPLRDAANIVCDNALRVDWERVCPPPEDGGEVFIAGNPPFVGTTYRTAEQKADFNHVFSGRVDSSGRLDFVSAWLLKAADYVRDHAGVAALLATSSTVQGASVEPLWTEILSGGNQIFFAHRSFKWRNNAARNAAVECVIVGLRQHKQGSVRLFDESTAHTVEAINAYLIAGQQIFVAATRNSLFGMPQMGPGNFPYDFGHLILSPEERDAMLDVSPEAAPFIRKFGGSREVIHGLQRFCLWIDDHEVEVARKIPEISRRIDAVKTDRLASKDSGTRRMAQRPHQFREHVAPKSHAILVPRTSSENRPYLPFDRVGADFVSSDNNHVILDAPDWCMALIASRLHLVWIGTVCGRLESRFRYSNTLGWNTFPVPKFTGDQLAALTASAMAILRCRYGHYPATIAQLYDPDKMPDDLRAAHKANDDLLESMYIGRPFRNDTERLEHLFKLYAARAKKLKKGAA